MIVQKSKSDRLQSIKKLNLWGSNLEDVSILSELPSLEVLSLSVNKIRTLKPFSSLKHLRELYLRNNLISDLREIQYLRNCRDLQILWINENPIADNKNYRQYIISILPNIAKLDDVMVTEAERQGGGDYGNFDQQEEANDEQNYGEEEDNYVNKTSPINKGRLNESPYKYNPNKYNDRSNDRGDDEETNYVKNSQSKNRYQDYYNKNEDPNEEMGNYGKVRRSTDKQRKNPANNNLKRSITHNQREYYQEQDDNYDDRPLPKNSYDAENNLKRMRSAQVQREANTKKKKFQNINRGYEDNYNEEIENYTRKERNNYEDSNSNLSNVAKSIMLLIKELNINELQVVKKEVEKAINEY